MTVDAELERIADIRALVRDVALSSNAPPACLDDLVQAVDEAATNIVLHGYERRGGAIDIDARLVDDHIVIVLSDTAPTFDPTTVPEPDLSVPAWGSTSSGSRPTRSPIDHDGAVATY